MFITFEGGEGAGKTTLIEEISQDLLLRGYPVLKTRAPGGTKAGETIRNLLLHKQDMTMSKRCELFLFLADRAQHVDEVILPALKEKKMVLCDRFNDSTVAYQSGARGFQEEFVKDLCAFASLKLVPDLTFYLDLDPKIGLERVNRTGESKDRIESETLAFHQSIREAFHRLANKEPHRFRILDASQAREHVFHAAKREIDALL